MRSLEVISFMFVAGLWLASEQRSADGCTLCIALPEKSAADYLIDSSCVVLAREDRDQPFSFAPVEVLKGDVNDTAIDLFLDSTTRRILAGDLNRSVILVQADDGGRWRSLGLATAEYEAVVRRILLLSPEWQGAEERAQRVEFFLPLFGHDDTQIRELAYLEMGRAPYPVIKRLSRVVSREQIEPFLRRPQYAQWRSLAILLTIHCGEARDRQYIGDSFRAAERFGLTANLAALAAASIEFDSADAVSFIEEKYFRNPDRIKEELIEVVRALSLHGTEGRTELRDQIVASYGVLLDIHPQLAPRVATDLLAWRRNEFTAKLARVEAADATLDYAGKRAVRRYLQVAAKSAASARLDDSSR